MNASALPAANAPTAALLHAPSALAGLAGNVPLTRVSLAYIEPRFKLYLRFGEPARTLQLDRWRRCAVFLPSAIFCRIRWQANDYGTVRWQLMVMQACTPLDAAQRIPGVQPGARLLLHAEGENQVRAVLERIDAIEALGIAPIAVSHGEGRVESHALTALDQSGLVTARFVDHTGAPTDATVVRLVASGRARIEGDRLLPVRRIQSRRRATR